MQNPDDARETHDILVQREVLTHVLANGSASSDPSELGAQLGDPAALERAVEVLTANDLLVREGDRIVPTPAAIRFHELEPFIAD